MIGQFRDHAVGEELCQRIAAEAKLLVEFLLHAVVLGRDAEQPQQAVAPIDGQIEQFAGGAERMEMEEVLILGHELGDVGPLRLGVSAWPAFRRAVCDRGATASWGARADSISTLRSPLRRPPLSVAGCKRLMNRQRTGHDVVQIVLKILLGRPASAAAAAARRSAARDCRQHVLKERLVGINREQIAEMLVLLLGPLLEDRSRPDRLSWGSGISICPSRTSTCREPSRFSVTVS